MKPYIGILIDSFWEAVGNRVLWALLIGWSLVLLGLAPFGYVSERSFQLSSADIDNRTQLIEKLAKGAKGQGSKAIQAVVAKLDDEFLQQVRNAVKEEGSGQRSIKPSELAKGLNAAVNAKGLFSEDDFPTASRRKRLEPLTAANESELSAADLEELNRELLQLAFPLELNRPRGEQLWIGYGGFKLGEPLPVSRRQISQFVEPLLLGFIIKLGLAVLAVFIAIVVTSPIIPDTFRSGSLHLLLSKPISRIWLYLFKFFGGCSFVMVNITFVLVGLYFIAGLRFDIWNNGLLACIPLLLFVFIVFYSVSGLAGLIWGNAIVCVVACMIFWLFCFSLGFMHDFIKPQVETLPQIRRIVEFEGHLSVVNEKGDFNVWNDEFSVWQPAIKSDNGGQTRTFGPIYDAPRNQVLVKSFFRVPFGNLVARSRKISIIDLKSAEPVSAKLEAQSDSSEKELTSEVEVASPDVQAPDAQAPNAQVSAANSTDNTQLTSAADARETPLWSSDQGPDLPPQVFDILEVGDTVLAICRSGLFRLNLEQLAVIEASEKALFGLKLPWGAMSAFENIAPKDYFLSENSYAAATTDGTGLVIYSSGSVDHLRLVNGKLELVNNTKLDGEGTEAAIVQMNANYCVVARDDLPLEILDSQLNPVAHVELPNAERVKQLAWVPDTDDVAIVTHTGTILRLACQTHTVSKFNLPFNGQCTCINWTDSGNVYLGIQPNRVILTNASTGEIKRDIKPAATMLESIYGWMIKPLYWVTPKPAALDNAMNYLLSGNETQAMNVVTNDLAAAQIELEIWPPILSNLAFVAFMLGISCIYVSRKEF